MKDWIIFDRNVELNPVERVAVIGYPSRPLPVEYERALGIDVTLEFDKLIDELYCLPDGYVPPEFGIQRVSFGEIQQQYSDYQRGILGHTSSTVGGNSGSLVVRLGDGSAVGLHFGGRGSVVDPQGMNLAVSSHVISDFLLEHGIGTGN